MSIESWILQNPSPFPDIRELWIDCGTDGWKTLRACILISPPVFDLDPVRKLPMDDLVAPVLGDALPSGSGEEDGFLKIQLNRGRYVMADAPSMAAETSTTDQREGSTSAQVGSYEYRDNPRSCGMR